LDFAVDDLAEGEGAGAVGALVTQAGGAALAVAEEDPRLAEELKGDEGVCLKAAGELDGKPAV
jgi:hypothetical protein